MMSELNEKTKIGLFTIVGFFVGTVPSIVLVVWFAAGINFKAETALADNLRQDQKIEKQETKSDAQLLLLIEIRDRIAKLEGRSK